MKTFALGLAITLLLIPSAAINAATLGETNTAWNEQIPNASTVGNEQLSDGSTEAWNEQLPGTAQDLYQIPNGTTQTYKDVSKNVDKLLNPDQPSNLSDSVDSARKIANGVQDLLNLPGRVKEDIEGLDVSALLDSAFSSILTKLLNKDMDEEWKTGTAGTLDPTDPIAVGDEIEQSISDETSGDFDLNPVIRATLAKKQYNRTHARARASTLLGEPGQTIMKLETQQTLKSVLRINQAAQQAQEFEVTQDVMKQIALQNTQLSQVIRPLLPEAQMTNLQIAATNANLADISSTLDAEQRAKAQEANAQANAFLRQAAFYNQLWEKGL